MKRFLSFILIFILILTSSPMKGLASAVPDRYGNVPEPIITVTDMDMPSIDPGKSRKVSVTLRSLGNHALDVVVNPRFTNPLSSNSFSSSISVGDKKVKIRPINEDAMNLYYDSIKDNYNVYDSQIESQRVDQSDLFFH